MPDVPLTEWSPRDVAAFLIKKNIPNHQIFLDNLVDGLTLSFLTHEELTSEPFNLAAVKARVLLSIVTKLSTTK